MTTVTRTFSWANNTAAAAKDWIGNVDQLVQDAGLIRTTDTGQLDVETIAAPSGQSTAYGYHVYRFPDTLHSTTPIFLRLTYYSESITAAKAAVMWTVGSGTNGAGTITNPSLSSTPSSTTSSILASAPSYACYVDGTFSMVLGYAIANNSNLNGNCITAVVVDRARDATGAAQAAGYLVEGSMQPIIANTVAGVVQSRSMYSTAPPSTSTNFVPALVPSTTATTSADAQNVNVFRHYMMVPGVKPSLGSLTFFRNEFGALAPLTVPVLGSDHTYLPLPAVNCWSATPNVEHAAAIRWE